MSGKSLRSLVIFIVMLGLAMWYFQDTRTPEEMRGQVTIAPGG